MIRNPLFEINHYLLIFACFRDVMQVNYEKSGLNHRNVTVPSKAVHFYHGYENVVTKIRLSF